MSQSTCAFTMFGSTEIPLDAQIPENCPGNVVFKIIVCRENRMSKYSVYTSDNNHIREGFLINFWVCGVCKSHDKQGSVIYFLAYAQWFYTKYKAS